MPNFTDYLEKLRSPEAMGFLRDAGIGGLAGGVGLGGLDYATSKEPDHKQRLKSSLMSGLIGGTLGAATGAGIHKINDIEQKQIPTPQPGQDNGWSLFRGATQHHPEYLAAAGAAAGGGKRFLQEHGAEKYFNDHLKGVGKASPSDWFKLNDQGQPAPPSELGNTVSTAVNSGKSRLFGETALSQRVLDKLKELSPTEAQLTGQNTISRTGGNGTTHGLEDHMDRVLGNTGDRSTGNILTKHLTTLAQKYQNGPLGKVLDHVAPATVKEYMMQGIHGHELPFIKKFMSNRSHPLMSVLAGGAGGYGAGQLLDNTGLGDHLDNKYLPDTIKHSIPEYAKQIQSARAASSR